jgi:membrane protease YdiL (CAAX protease family)
MIRHLHHHVRKHVKKADPLFWIAIISISVNWILRILFIPLPPTDTLANVVFNFIVRVGFFLVPVIAWDLFRKHKLKKDFALLSPQRAGVVIAAAYIVILVLFELALGKSFRFTTDLFILLNVPFAPIIEELLYRGVMMTYLLERGSSTRAILISTALFVIAHWPGWILYSHHSVQGFLLASFQVAYFGLALGYVRHKSNSVYPPIVMHIINNYLSFARI